MNEIIVANWNNKVKPDDTVYLLGDVSFAGMTKTEDVVNRLNGKIWLIRGNHDSRKLISLDRWEDVKMIHFEQIDDIPVVMCHYPIESWPWMEQGSLMLHGHCHNGTSHSPIQKLKNRLDIGVDTRADMSPWSWEEILSELKYQKVQ